MRVVPRNQGPQISFFQSHAPKWLEQAAELGVDPAIVADLVAATEEAQQLYSARSAAALAERMATQRLNSGLERMNDLGAAVLSQVKAKARIYGGQIYSLASISPPDKPAPIARPGTPTNLKVELGGLGWLTLKWSCKNPRGSQGTLYRVSRTFDSIRGPFEFLGVVGEKKFVDDSIPHGTVSVTYEIQAVRSTSVGPVGNFSVALNSLARNLGMAGLGNLPPRKVA